MSGLDRVLWSVSPTRLVFVPVVRAVCLVQDGGTNACSLSILFFFIFIFFLVRRPASLLALTRREARSIGNDRLEGRKSKSEKIKNSPDPRVLGEVEDLVLRLDLYKCWLENGNKEF